MLLREYISNRVFLFILVVVIFVIFSFQPYDLKKYFQPIKYNEIIIEEAALHSVDSNLLAAIIFVESSFDENAVSQKGALGLMQIMPETAHWIAEQKNIDNFSLSELNNPDINIRFGTWYLAELLEEFDNDLILALAAYNAGQGNVKKWLKSGWDGKIKDKRSIPFGETDDFIRKVLETRDFYQKYNRLK